MKKKIALFAVFALLFGAVAWPMTLKASGTKASKNIYIAENEFVPFNFVVAGGNIDFLGEAQKDVIVFGGNVNIRGPVHGDIIIAGGNVKISSNVDGNIRVVGGDVEISGKVGKNISAAGGTVLLTSASEVGWDLMVAGGNINLRGAVNGNVNMVAGSAILGGKIGGRVDSYFTRGSEISFLPETKIMGGFEYWSASEVVIPDGVEVGGEVKHNLVKGHNKSTQAVLYSYLFKIIVNIFSLLIIGFIIIKLFYRQTKMVHDELKKSPWMSFGWGFISLIIIPIIAVLLLISIIGVPLAMIMVVFYGLIIYLSKIIIALFVGQFIYDKYSKKQGENSVEIKTGNNKEIRSMFAGVFVFVLIASVPVLGPLIYFLTTILVFGAVMRIVMRWVNGKNAVVVND